MRLAKGLVAGAIVTSLLGLAASARANGRFPAAGQIAIDPGDPSHLVVRTTYGLVESFDAGAFWRWICEPSVGFDSIEDPELGITSDGTILAGLVEGLTVSHDRGCGFAFAPAPLASRWAIDLAVDVVAPSHAVAIVAAGGGAGPLLVETLDDGKTWSQAGVALPPEFHPVTVDAAPSRPSRVYVSGTSGQPPAGVLERTDDRGATWTALPVPLGTASAPWIAAVDPIDPDTLYLRLDDDPDDRLEVSHDGGATFTKIHTTPGQMLGCALSPDGQSIAVGGPKEALQVASTADYAFSQAAAVEPWCLAWTPSGLYACAMEASAGFTAGVSSDDGASFHGLYHESQLCALDCPATTTTGAKCPALWPVVQASLGVPAGYACPAVAADAGSEAGEGGAVDAASDAAAVDAGAGGGQGEDAGAGADASLAPAEPPGAASRTSGCACLAGVARGPASPWALLALASLWHLRRRPGRSRATRARSRR